MINTNEKNANEELKNMSDLSSGDIIKFNHICLWFV